MYKSDLKACIFIPTYNASKTIAKTIKGVIKCISELPLSVFVYDDCSSDNTLEIIKDSWTLTSIDLIIKKNEFNIGLFQNTNRALAELSKSYNWAFLMHQDDTPYDNWVLKNIEVIKSHTDNKTFVIWCNYNNYNFNTSIVERIGDLRGVIEKKNPTPENIAYYITNIYTWYSLSGSVFNTFLVKQLNYFDEKYKHFGDTDFIVRGLLTGFNHIYIALPLLERTFSSFQASSVNQASFIDINEMNFFFKRFSKYLSKSQRRIFFRYLIKIITKRSIKLLLHFKFSKAYSIMVQGYKLTSNFLIP